jgi:hypothetical protein
VRRRQRRRRHARAHGAAADIGARRQRAARAVKNYSVSSLRHLRQRNQHLRHWLALARAVARKKGKQQLAL